MTVATLRVAQEIEGVFIPAGADRPAALAELFCQMFADDQAKFFDTVAVISGGWEKPACFQWRNMEDDITPKARAMLREMLDHTEKNGSQ